MSQRKAWQYRAIYEKHYGPIPDGYDIHHIDGDHTNNHPNNLQAISKSDHMRIHAESISKGVKGYWDNIPPDEYESRCKAMRRPRKPMTEEQKRQRSEAMKAHYAQHPKPRKLAQNTGE